MRQIQSLIVRHSTHPQHPSPIPAPSPPVPRLAVTLPSILCVTACRGSLCSKPRGFLRCLLPHVLPPCTRFTARTRYLYIVFSFAKPGEKVDLTGDMASQSFRVWLLSAADSFRSSQASAQAQRNQNQTNVELTEAPSGDYFSASLFLPENEQSTGPRPSLVTLRVCSLEPVTSGITQVSSSEMIKKFFFLAQTPRTQSDFWLSVCPDSTVAQGKGGRNTGSGTSLSRQSPESHQPSQNLGGLVKVNSHHAERRLKQRHTL